MKPTNSHAACDPRERVHRLHDARPGHERAEDRQEEVTMTSVTFHTRSMLRRSCTMTECRTPCREPRQQGCILDRIPSPVAAPAKLFVRPDHAEHEPERQEQPGDHRPAAHGPQPRIVEVAGDERRHPEREGDRHADEPM